MDIFKALNVFFLFFYLMPSWYFEIFLIALGREGEEVSNGT